MPDYKLGKIYKLVSKNTKNVYIGSTTEKYLSQRVSSHRRDYRRWKKGTHGYVCSFEIIKKGDVKGILLENYPCSSKDELHARERKWIEETQNCINHCIPTRTKAEYEKLEKTKLYRKQYSQTVRSQKKKCACGGQYTISNKSTHFKTDKHKDWVKKNESESDSD